MANINFTIEQLELGAKYFTASNTGLIGCGHDKPTSKREIKQVFYDIDAAYVESMGEGLSGELEMWKKTLQNDDGSWQQKMKEEIPFVFES